MKSSGVCVMSDESWRETGSLPRQWHGERTRISIQVSFTENRIVEDTSSYPLSADNTPVVVSVFIFCMIVLKSGLCLLRCTV